MRVLLLVVPGLIRRAPSRAEVTGRIQATTLQPSALPKPRPRQPNHRRCLHRFYMEVDSSSKRHEVETVRALGQNRLNWEDGPLASGPSSERSRRLRRLLSAAAPPASARWTGKYA
jgi:hypothetical protein